MKITNFDLANTIMENLVDNKVGYYWEGAEYYPVVEVFNNDREFIRINKKVSLKSKLEYMGIDNDIAQVGIELLEAETDYYRLFVTLSRDITDNQLIMVIEILSTFGESKYQNQF
jgi:uncharacterized alpha/beta hydrolase family protein